MPVEGDVMGKQREVQSWGINSALCWETASPEGPMSEQGSSEKRGSIEEKEQGTRKGRKKSLCNNLKLLHCPPPHLSSLLMDK